MHAINGLDLFIILALSLLLWAATGANIKNKNYVFDMAHAGEVLSNTPVAGNYRINAEYTEPEKRAILDSLQTLRDLRAQVKAVLSGNPDGFVGMVAIDDIQIMHDRAERAFRVITTMAGLHWSQQSATSKAQIIRLRGYGSDLCSSAGSLASKQTDDATIILTSIVSMAAIAPEAVA